MSDSMFTPDASGYVRHWLVTEVNKAPYEGPKGTDAELRRRVVDSNMTPPGENMSLGESGPYGKQWRFYDPGANIFVEQSGFYHSLSVLDFYAATNLKSPREGEIDATLWACGCADLWINGQHLGRNACTRYKGPEPMNIVVPLKQGLNRLRARVRTLGVRDTPFLFGLQLAELWDGCRIQLPGPENHTSEFSAATQWLDTVRVAASDRLQAEDAPPFETVVETEERTVKWTETGSCQIPEHFRLTVKTSVENQELSRDVEIPANKEITTLSGNSTRESRDGLIRQIGARENPGTRHAPLIVLARHTRGQRDPGDTEDINRSCRWIDGRPDCADFPLAALLRLMHGTTLTDDERHRIRRTALNFRYWTDEPGVDALCFHSENHSLLFHSCQMLAGNLFPNATFSNSDRTGREQAKLGQQRCTDWVEERLAHGFSEYLSGTYIPITVAALLNVVDFAHDETLASKASTLVDRVFRTLANHTFDGVTMGPQGRVYRGVLYPEDSGTQAMLAYACPECVTALNPWVAFVAATDRYELPDDLADRQQTRVSTIYEEAKATIHLHKTSDYLVSSLEIPDSSANLLPGQGGYQEHLWYASLARDCHVFVNHPGASYDLSPSRPGFWYGNGVLPRLHQDEGTLLEIFDIDPEHPIPFTHAHWPADAFDEHMIDRQWAIGRRNNGYVGLWCSQPLNQRSEVLTDRELRAEGRRVAWILTTGTTAEHPSLLDFGQACRAAEPQFDADSLELRSNIGSLDYQD